MVDRVQFVDYDLFMEDYFLIKKYLDALHILLRSDNSNQVDSVIVFLFRHTLEVVLKMLEKMLFKESKNGHNLEKIKIRLLTKLEEDDLLDGEEVIFTINPETIKLIDVFFEEYNLNIEIKNRTQKLNLNDFFRLTDKYNFDTNNTKTRYSDKSGLTKEEVLHLYSEIELDIGFLSNFFLFISYIILSKFPSE